MSSIAVHMRMTGLQISNEDVTSRQAATAALVVAWGKLKSPGAIVVKAAEVAHSLAGAGAAPTLLSAEVEALVQVHAPAFLGSERPLEIGICAGIGAMALMATEPGQSGWSMADIFANALWSALAFQAPLLEPKREAMRAEVLEAARVRSAKSAELARERSVVNDVGDLVMPSSQEAAGSTVSLKKAAGATIEALRRNAALDREELDFEVAPFSWTVCGLGNYVSACAGSRLA